AGIGFQPGLKILQLEVIEVLLIFDTAPADPDGMNKMINFLRDKKAPDSHCAQEPFMTAAGEKVNAAAFHVQRNRPQGLYGVYTEQEILSPAKIPQFFKIAPEPAGKISGTHSDELRSRPKHG